MTPRATAFVATLLLASSAAAADFSYKPAGTLVSGSGTGRVDSKIYAPGMRFPIEKAPAYANSQVWGHGGNSGPGRGQGQVQHYHHPRGGKPGSFIPPQPPADSTVLFLGVH